MEKIVVEVSKGEYKGDPMMTFTAENDRYPFSFGKAKCAKMIKGILDYGLKETLCLISEVADDALSPEEAQAFNDLVNDI